LGRRGKQRERRYFGGAGANPSRLRPGSGFALGLGAFLTSFLPLSLLPMGPSVTQKGDEEKGQLQIEGFREAGSRNFSSRTAGFCMLNLDLCSSLCQVLF